MRRPVADWLPSGAPDRSVWAGMNRLKMVAEYKGGKERFKE